MEAQITQKSPYNKDLGPGQYWWCACGKSSNQPFCNGAHKGTGIVPVKFETTESKEVWLCGCKQTTNPPHCDGAHKKL